jgi:hypothetical protein
MSDALDDRALRDRLARLTEAVPVSTRVPLVGATVRPRFRARIDLGLATLGVLIVVVVLAIGATSQSPASSAPTEKPSPGSTFVPLASILTWPLPKQSEAGAKASIARMFAVHPRIANAFLNGSANIPLVELAPDARCFSIRDVRTYEAQAPYCLVSFQALRQAYRMSGDPGFITAAADVLGAMRQYLPTALFLRFERDLQGLSDFLESQTRL